MRILAISGSLRAASSNTALLRAAARLAPDGVSVAIYGDLERLPPFNPDLDPDSGGADLLPTAVRALRAEVGRADGLLIASPEYAHGVSGVLKNALDWLVGDLEFAGKPVALLNAAPRATHAQAALAETLRTMAATLVPEASVTLPVGGRGLDAEAIEADPALAQPLRAAVDALALAIRQHRIAGGA